MRHEQAAAFAAEGWAKATRTPGVCALTAGPGVTNGMSALASARSNGTPIVVLGGRAPEMRWGSGSLQEIDHLPFVSPLTKSAETVKEAELIGDATVRAFDLAGAAPTGPTYLDYPLDVVFTEADADIPDAPAAAAPEVAADVERGGGAAGRRRAPGDHGRHRPRTGRTGRRRSGTSPSAPGSPSILNGMGRGCIPADHELAFSRTRGSALKGADVAVIVGVPLDFRLGFGGAIGADTKLIRVDVEPNRLERNRVADVDLVGDVAATLEALAAAAVSAGASPDRTRDWVDALRRRGGREARGGGRGPRRPPRAAASDAPLRRARGGPRPEHDRDRRRRRLRLLRRPRDRHPRSRDLDGPGPVRMPRRRSRSGDRRRLRPPGHPRSACCWATAHSASAGSSSTRWSATACRSSA